MKGGRSFGIVVRLNMCYQKTENLLFKTINLLLVFVGGLACGLMLSLDFENAYKHTIVIEKENRVIVPLFIPPPKPPKREKEPLIIS